MINLEEQFKYHPPDEERARKHTRLNEAALEFARVVWQEIDNRDTIQGIVNQIQIARMLANQAITYESLEQD